MPSAVELADGDVLLRPWTEDEARAVGLTPASPEIGRYFGPAFDAATAAPDPEAPAFAIVAGGVPVGRIWCAAHRRPFEVGYFLRPEAWGRGLATRSLLLVRDFLLAAGEEEVVLCTHPGNERSQRVLRRAGFTPIGNAPAYLHIAGRWADHRLFQVVDDR